MGQAPAGEACNATGQGVPLIAGASDLGETVPAPKKFTTRPTKTCRPGDLILCIRATIGDRNWADRAYCLGRGVAGLRPTDAVDPRYLWHWLGSAAAALNRSARGSTFTQVDKASIGRLRIPLPQGNEQRRIAAVLDKADAIRHKRRQAMQLTDDLLRSTFLDMFGDPVSNPRPWPVATIAELAPERGLVVDGPFGSSLKPECYVATGVRVIRNVNIKPGRFDGSEFKFVTAEKFEELRRSEVAPGDILISTKGTVGNVCVMPDLKGPSLLSATGTVRVRLPNESHVRRGFLVAQMTNEHYRSYIASLQAGSNQQYLNLSAIRSMRVIAPPLRVQERWLEFKREIDRLGADNERSAVVADEAFATLVHRAFCGDLV